MGQTAQKSTIVVGAGIIGASIAYELQKCGRNVILIDRDPPGMGASFGNMASIAVTEFLPVARPSIWMKIPGWVLDPEGPIRISPRYSPYLAPWFLRFMMASAPAKVRQVEHDGAVLCERALKDTENLLAEIGLSDHLSETGCLSLYASDAEFNADSERFEMLDRFGIDYAVLNAQKTRDLEPEISPKITKSVLMPNNRTVRDPYSITQRLIEIFEARGGQVIQASVNGFEQSDKIRAVLLDNDTALSADEVVICAGAFTARLSKLLVEPMPLESERGYSTQIMAPGLSLSHSIIWPAKAFMVSPTAGGIRVGGTVEMAGLDAEPNFNRAKVTVKRASEALPNLQVRDATEWMGHRPATPDTIPILSASAKIKGVFYATGHGHLGLTNAATTATLMGQLITGKSPSVDLHPYRVNRF